MSGAASCECCGQAVTPMLSIEDYNARAVPRLAAIDALSARIDFESMVWRSTPEGERWLRLMALQGADEQAAGL